MYYVKAINNQEIG